MIPWLVLLQASLAIAVAGPPTSPEYLPLRLAEAEGHFARERLAVTLRPTRAETAAAEALARGEVQVAATSLDAALRLGHHDGQPPLLVFGLTAAPPVVVLVPAARGEQVRSLADLRGLKVGVPAPGSPEDVALHWLLAKAGVGRRDVVVVSHGQLGLVAALEAGQVAAAVVADPWATRLLDEGKAVALADLRTRSEAARLLSGATVHAAVFVRADSRLAPADLGALARALLGATRRLESATPEELAGRLPPAVVGDPADFTLRLRGAREAYLPGGRVSVEALEASLALVRSRSPLPYRVDMPWRASCLLLTDHLSEKRR